MPADRHRLRKEFRAIRDAEKRRQPVDRRLARWKQELQRSIALYKGRRAGVPTIRFDEDLPVSQRRDEIAVAIRDHQVVIVCGETGSGKSTQLPKICLTLGRGIERLIGHTQPRRIAARSIAARIAEELGTPLGHHVGYKIRFADATSPNTYIKLMTDGILLAEIQSDPLLDQYDTIILDEAHERSLNIDFLIGCLKRILPKRRDLKLIITSATLDADRFAKHFATAAGPAPVVEVSGRTYPVETRWRPIERDEEGDEPDPDDALFDAVAELASLGPGDILIFMPTERDIHGTAKDLRGRKIPGVYSGRTTEILPLYARLSIQEQQRIFQPHAGRRIVIATNVAESSLTVPGIRYVIDPGTARISRYSPRTKTQRLPIEAISRASADQRAGRCGRIGPGVCVRLYSEEDYQGRERFTPPEIQRSNLAAVILQMKAFRFGQIESFPFLDPPRADAIRDGYKTLVELGAFDEHYELTELGRQLSRLPVDPRIGRMILAARDENCLSEVLVIAAALEIQDPRERPLEKQEAADECHAQFADPDSDFLGYLKLWDFYHQLKGRLSRGQLRKACRQNFLSHNRMREWTDIHLQLLDFVGEAGLRPGPPVVAGLPTEPRRGRETRAEPLTGLRPGQRRDEYEPIHRAILTGLLSSVAMCGESGQYSVAGGGKALLWPGSGIASGKPWWVVAAEVVETGRRYLRCCAKIQARWVEPIAAHLVKRSYSDIHWDRDSASAVAMEKVSLFGLTLVSGRRVRYGPIDPAASRELLIQHGLVEGEMDRPPEFLVHNQKLMEEMEQLQAKLRRNDLLLGPWARYEFYDRRIPPDVYDGPRLTKWLHSAHRKDPRVLHMTKADLVQEDAAEVPPEQFPDSIPVERMELPLDYQFEPGAEEDGVTLVVPQEALSQLDPQQLGWLVPGLLEARITALIRSLPKTIRRLLVPAPDTARRALEELRFGEGDMREAVSRVLSRIAGQRISPHDFEEDKVPDSLRMNLRVVDAEGNPLAHGRDVDAVRRQLGMEAAAAVSALDDPQWNRDGLVTWDLDELPEEVELRRGGLCFKAYPMLVDRQQSVSLRLTDSRERAASETRHGLRRLFVLAESRRLQEQVHWMPGLDQMLLNAGSLRNFDLRQELAELVADRAYLGGRVATTPLSRPGRGAGGEGALRSGRGAGGDGAPCATASQKQCPSPQPQGLAESVAHCPLPRSAAEFKGRLKAGRERLGLAVQEVMDLVGPLLEAYHQARLALEQAAGPKWAYAAADVREQLDRLITPGFLTRTPWEWLKHFPRYLRAIPIRLDSLRSGGLARDRKHTKEIQALWQAYCDRARQHQESGIFDPELALYRWMLEEYRISCFAQRLGTAIPVSARRLERQWEKVRV